MKSDTFKSCPLASIQAVTLILLFISDRPIANDLPFVIIEIAGITLGIWAFIIMGWRNLTITPLVKQGVNYSVNGNQ